MRPPFSLFATKKTGRARSKRKTLGRKAGAAGAFFACIRGSQQETALQNLSRSVGRGPSLAESFSRQPATNCLQIPGQSTIHQRSLSAAAAYPREGNPKGRGRESQCRDGVEIEAPHVYAGSADAISFGRRLIPPGFTSAQRNGPRMTGRLMPGLFGGAWGDTSLFKREMSPLSPSPPRRGKNYFSSNTDTYTVPTTSKPSLALI